MRKFKKTFIKFKNQQLNELRARLLKDLDDEYYAILSAKTNNLDDVCIITVNSIVYFNGTYNNQSFVSIHVGSSFRAKCLQEILDRIDQ